MHRDRKSYTIVGYDKDADVYVRLATIYNELPVAISVADHMATLGLRRLNGERFDWLEVVTPHEDIRHHVAQCTDQNMLNSYGEYLLKFANDHGFEAHLYPFMIPIELEKGD